MYNVTVKSTDLDRDGSLGRAFFHDLFFASLLVLRIVRQTLGPQSQHGNFHAM